MLTDSLLKSITGKPYSGKTEITDRDGLSVRITTKGTITFQIRFRRKGKAARCDIGTYPMITLKTARTENDRLKGLMSKGHDPRIILKTEKQSVISARDYAQVMTDWHEDFNSRKSSGNEILRSLEVHVIPEFGKIPLDEIDEQMWLARLQSIKRKSPSIAVRVLTNSRQIYRWAIKRRLASNNPLSEFSSKEDLGITKNSTERTLSDYEISLFFKALKGSKIAEKNKYFMLLCLYYGCRNGELRKAKKSDFDFNNGVWTIPPENHKMGWKTKETILKPITPEMETKLLCLFKLSNNEYIVPNGKKAEPLSTTASISLPYRIMQWVKVNERVSMDHWTLHDLRRTARTNFSPLTDYHVAEIMIGHKLPGEWATYDKHHYLDEQSKTYTKWIDKLNNIQDSSI